MSSKRWRPLLWWAAAAAAALAFAWLAPYDRQVLGKLPSEGAERVGQADVLVIDPQGNVLARALGPFDPAKAQALRETVLAQGGEELVPAVP